MDSNLFTNASYSSQPHPSIHLSPDQSARRSFFGDGSGFLQTSNSRENTFSSGPYTSALQPNSGHYDTTHTAYPESSQRTASTVTTLRTASDAGTFDGLSNFNSNHYEAAFDFDTPQLTGTASGNGSLFDQYGGPSLRNDAGGDHRSSPLPTRLSGTPFRDPGSSNTHVHGHLSPSHTTIPLYPPAMSPPSHAMTSYTGDSASSNTTSTSHFPRVPPSSKPSYGGPGFDMPQASSGMDYGIAYDDPTQLHQSQGHHRKGHSHPIKPRTPSMSPSIPMRKAHQGHSGEGYASRPHSSSSSLSSANTTPTFTAAALSGRHNGRLQFKSKSPLPPANEASAGTIQLLQQEPPYGSEGRSSVTPPVEVLHADPGLGDRSLSNPTIPPAFSGGAGMVGLDSHPVVSRPTSSSSLKKSGSGGRDTTPPLAEASRSVAAPSLEAEPLSQQPPAKKKKKSKMHTCEICSKKFPRPSGLRTHMNTHNNARPYACGFPGCTRTFGVRSNAKRHLRTHGIVPPPSNGTGNGENAYVVGFSPPVIAHGPTSNSSPGGLTSDASGTGLDGAVEEVSGQLAKHRLARAPFFKLRWMPLSLTSRTNAGKLKSVDEVTGEVSDDDDESEGDDEGNGSDRDRDGYGRDEEDREGPGGGGGRQMDSKMGSMLGSATMLGSISLPALSHGVPLGGEQHTANTASTRALPSRSSSHSSSYSTASTLTSSTSGTSISTSSVRECVCLFGVCLSTPCRTLALSGTGSGGATRGYTTSPAMDEQAVSSLALGGYASSLRSLQQDHDGLGFLGGGGASGDAGNMGMGGGSGVGNAQNHSNLSLSTTGLSSMGFSLGHGMDVGLGLGGGVSGLGGGLGFGSPGLGGSNASGSVGVSSLYARRVGLNAARQSHLLASA